jgi:hypothetical protein
MEVRLRPEAESDLYARDVDADRGQRRGVALEEIEDGVFASSAPGGGVAATADVVERGRAMVDGLDDRSFPDDVAMADDGHGS